MISTVILENALTHPPKVCTGVQVTNVIAWMAARKFPLESYAVGIMGILVHDPIHVGSRFLSAGDSFREVSGSLLDGHVNGCIYHLLIALRNSAYYAIVGRLEPLRG